MYEESMILHVSTVFCFSRKEEQSLRMHETRYILVADYKQKQWKLFLQNCYLSSTTQILEGSGCFISQIILMSK